MYLYLFGSCVGGSRTVQLPRGRQTCHARAHVQPGATCPVPAYLNVIGDQLTPLAVMWKGEDSFVAHRDFLITVCAIVVILPLCLLKKIE